MEKILNQKIHPMVKKSIINFIEKEKLSKNLMKKVEKLLTIEDLVKFEESLTEAKNQNLKEFISKKLEAKLKKKEEPVYLDFDFKIFLAIANNRKVDFEILNTKEAKELVALVNEEDKEYSKIFELVSKMRNDKKDRYDINRYCVDNIYNLSNYVLKVLNLLNKEEALRKEFIEVAKLIDGDTLSKKEYFEYFLINVSEKELLKEEVDYIFMSAKKYNIKKSVFKASEIKTKKDALAKIVALITELFYGDENKRLDLYSIQKSIEVLRF